MIINQLYQIEFDLSNKCNAQCPQCVRNFYGSYTWPSVPLIDLDINILKKSISLTTWANLKHVRLCGTYGDPCMHKDLIDIVQWIKSVSSAKITINTNGGIRSVLWWKQLAQTLNTNDMVIFGLDGLEDTNHLYRINVNYKKVIKNLTAFIQAGGTSIWQFLVFKHNEHQIDQARELANKLGCKEFIVKRSSRFVNKSHKIVNNTPVLDNHGNVLYLIEPPTDTFYVNEGYKNITSIIHLHRNYKQYLKETTIDCMSKILQYINITAEGNVFPCGWLADRMYGFETETHKDHNKLMSIIDSIGGLEKINLHHTPLEDIIKGPWFSAVEESWKDNSIERCANQCGNNNLIASASKGQFKSLLDIK
jgi:MoaA/NifB/PqqE/SkfB family radical SAM enzyme